MPTGFCPIAVIRLNARNSSCTIRVNTVGIQFAICLNDESIALDERQIFFPHVSTVVLIATVENSVVQRIQWQSFGTMATPIAWPILCPFLFLKNSVSWYVSKLRMMCVKVSWDLAVGGGGGREREKTSSGAYFPVFIPALPALFSAYFLCYSICW